VKIINNQCIQHGKIRIILALNQTKYILLDRSAGKSELVQLCKDLGITSIAYSPLENGILTGKYNVNNPPSDIRSWRYNKTCLKKIELLIDEFKATGMTNWKNSGAGTIKLAENHGYCPNTWGKGCNQSRGECWSNGMEFNTGRGQPARSIERSSAALSIR
jgi:hypothetical protein